MTVPKAPVCVAATRKQSPNEATTNRVVIRETSASKVAAGTGKPGGVEAADLNGAGDEGVEEEEEGPPPSGIADADAAISLLVKAKAREIGEGERASWREKRGALSKVKTGLVFFFPRLASAKFLPLFSSPLEKPVLFRVSLSLSLSICGVVLSRHALEEPAPRRGVGTQRREQQQQQSASAAAQPGQLFCFPIAVVALSRRSRQGDLLRLRRSLPRSPGLDFVVS